MHTVGACSNIQVDNVATKISPRSKTSLDLIETLGHGAAQCIATSSGGQLVIGAFQPKGTGVRSTSDRTIAVVALFALRRERPKGGVEVSAK
eukprot:3946670-Pyramimonas_sp.AAC.1